MKISRNKAKVHSDNKKYVFVYSGGIKKERDSKVKKHKCRCTVNFT